MTERRETGRKSRKNTPKRPPNQKNKSRSNTRGRRSQSVKPDWSEGERIAKYLARAGVASRREVERLIEAGEVWVDGVKLKTPAFKVTGRETIKVKRRTIHAPEPTRLWRYHKPAGLITTTNDPAGRRIIFDELPKWLPRVVTVGRLDLNTEGLLLLTNDGELSRTLELPKSELVRTYRARAHGRITDEKIARLADGMVVNRTHFSGIDVTLDRETGSNTWLMVSLKEGKKREVRRALEAVDLKVNRLIRISYGPYELADLKPGAVEEVPEHELSTFIRDLKKQTRATAK